MFDLCTAIYLYRFHIDIQRFIHQGGIYENSFRSINIWRVGGTDTAAEGFGRLSGTVHSSILLLFPPTALKLSVYQFSS